MNLKIGDLIPLQGLTKEDKKKLVDIVNKAEANQSTIKTNIINTLNNKIGSNLRTDNSWIDVVNAISNATGSKRYISGTAITDSRGHIVVSDIPFQPRLVYVNIHENKFYMFRDASITQSSGFFSSNIYSNCSMGPNNFDINIHWTSGENVTWEAYE
ncbi:hypothetical protein NPD5_289 [Clostridium sporogenes]|uniref:Uncharacterized protein n=1 Tax=Clostridium sporogenes TaxID=1509 RepID=A0A1J1D2K5_CLOSG|nr:hypothetical protein [Clostridium sporogenes]APF29004.1 hypothetical protein NPD7_1276 [Clostridium sporogenes]APH15465.1 hypothetical protein NPD5_289 [Clostridium sporogenes]